MIIQLAYSRDRDEVAKALIHAGYTIRSIKNDDPNNPYAIEIVESVPMTIAEAHIDILNAIKNNKPNVYFLDILSKVYKQGVDFGTQNRS